MIKGILLLCVGVVIGAAMSMSFQDEKQYQEFYCKMVQEKAWPDYRGIAAAECK